MSGVATAIAVTGTYGAYQSGKAAKDAARSQEASAQQGIEFQREALEALRSDLDPFRQFGQAALGNLAGMLGTQDNLSQLQIQQAARQQAEQDQQPVNQKIQLSGEGSLFSQVAQAVQAALAAQDAPSEPSQFASDPKKMSEYQSQLNLVNSMDPSDPNYNQARMVLEARESQLPIEDLASITPITDLGKERLGTYYLEKGITPPSGVTKMQRRPDGGYEKSPRQEIAQGQDSYQRAGNPLLQQAMAERAAYDPMNNPLLARAQQERMEFDPLSNPLLARAAEQQMARDPLGDPLLQSAREKALAFDPMTNLGEGVLQNPLLKAMQEDVTRRLMANQAARGKLGSGGTAEELQNRLVPQAIQFGQMLNQEQRQQIQDQARLGLQSTELGRQNIGDLARMGGVQVGLQEAAMAGREGLGFGLDQLQRQATTDRLQAGLTQEDLQQRQIANLMDAARMGQASAAQTGQAGQSAASAMGNLSLAQGQAQAAGSLGRAQAINQGLGSIAGAGLYALGNVSPGAGSGGTFNQFQPTTGQFGQFTGL